MSEINAIATNNYILHNIDAKKLYVQEPLFTANSGDAVYVGWRPDETVLFENQTNTTANMILSEPLSNFDYFEMYGHWNYNNTQCIRAYNKIWTNSARGYNNVFSLAGYGVGNLQTGNTDYFFCGTDYSANGTTITVRKCMRNNLLNNLYSNTDGLIVDKIIGVNRKENA